ncbi:MAG: phenylalanine--tRNA ligase subunit alpha [Oscillospiraceae bacterium]|nr:phenylalanine--tRNA ligase subunit alpha [Oscillospiraceae bacterium]
MKQQLENIRQLSLEQIAAAKTPAEIDDIRVRVLGKKGEVTAILKQMGKLSAEERPVMGALANEVRETVEKAIEAKLEEIKKELLEKQLVEEELDITLPGNEFEMGKRHPIQLVLDELKEIFLGMGFSIASGPEVELDKYNFEMLNMPKSHPSRDTQDTFYITENIVLRTQTSPVQVRTMLNEKLPIRIIAPGRVYRADEVDATHSPLFHQIEGLVIDENITMADLKGTLEAFVKNMFGPETKVRFRPHHFAYTEPSAEMDMTCFKCGGKGCRLCKGEGWIEILGSGIVNPVVLEACGIDSTKYSGFAFGMGLERLTMMRYDIDDMRLMYENDMRFLSQF